MKKEKTKPMYDAPKKDIKMPKEGSQMTPGNKEPPKVIKEAIKKGKMPMKQKMSMEKGKKNACP